jgi:acetyl esterase/lipase
MRSIKGRLIIWYIKNRHIFKGKIKRPGVDEGFSVEEFRKRVDERSLKMEKIPEDITVEKLDIDGIYGEYIIPENAPENKILMYIHGGGFISGDCNSHRMHMVNFAQGTGVKVLQFNYRMAPEDPFPAPVEDCVKVYCQLLKKYPVENIIIGGESAGGTLTLSTLAALKKMEIPYPAGSFAVSPVTNLSRKAESVISNEKKDIAKIGAWELWTKMYIADTNLTDTVLSPALGNLTGYPPLLLYVGSHETLLDDAVEYANKAIESGVDVAFKIWQGMVHAWPLMAPMFKEATQAHQEICGFVKERLGE